MAKGGTRTERLSATIRCINALQILRTRAELPSRVNLQVLPVALITGVLISIDRVSAKPPADL